MSRYFLLALLATCWGCTTTAVPVVKEALKCDAPPSLLAACAEPVAIKQGVTFGEMITLTAADRDAFQACALRQRSLAALIADCNDTVEKYNAEIREINARNAARQ
jgi:hypothetical protein